VVDDRVPGDSVPELREYRCAYPGCEKIIWSEAVPECPVHHMRMPLRKKEKEQQP
jgi:hypothetical protein